MLGIALAMAVGVLLLAVSSFVGGTDHGIGSVITSAIKSAIQRAAGGGSREGRSRCPARRTWRAGRGAACSRSCSPLRGRTGQGRMTARGSSPACAPGGLPRPRQHGRIVT
jgi:hypothetical protein